MANCVCEEYQAVKYDTGDKKLTKPTDLLASLHTPHFGHGAHMNMIGFGFGAVFAAILPLMDIEGKPLLEKLKKRGMKRMRLKK
jgi:hypothetical protein